MRTLIALLLVNNLAASYYPPWPEYHQHHHQPPPSHKIPRDVIVDVINNLGLSLLEVHNTNNDNNIAVSPYGAASVLVALYEGVAGEAALEIKHAINLPHDLEVIRVGLRDIHRHLKSYFIPTEGFLSGLTLSHDNITLNREYESILKFYGYDIETFNNPPTSNPTTISPITTTLTTTTEEETTAAAAVTISDTLTSLIERLTSIVTPEPTTMLMPTETTPTTSETTSLPSTTIIIPTTEITPSITTTTESVTTEMKGREADVTDVEQTIKTTTIENTTPTTTREDDDVFTTAERLPAKSTTTESSSTTTQITTTNEAAASTAVNDVSTTSVFESTKQPAMSFDVTTDAAEKAGLITNDGGDNEMTSTDAITTTTTMLTTTSEVGEDDNATTERRKRRSVIDYLVSRYYDNYHINNHHKYLYLPKGHYEPETPYTFLINGVREPNISFMTYDTVLPYCYIAELDAMALSFPLDSDMYYLLLILPNEELGIDKLIYDLKKFTTLGRIVENLKYTHVNAIIPSFMLKGYVVLTASLQKLCIRKIFEPRHADFTQMTEEKNIYVTNIEQAITVTIRNYMDIVGPVARSFQSARPVEFHVDHPFLFFVMDAKIHVNLMAGKIVNPLNTRIS